MVRKFTEPQLEAAIIELLGKQGYSHIIGSNLQRDPESVLIKDDLRAYLLERYVSEGLTADEVESVVPQLESLPASGLYDSNKTFSKWLTDGFIFKRDQALIQAQGGDESCGSKDLFIQLVDDVLVSEVLEEFAEALVDMMADIKTEMHSFEGVGIDFEEKTFYDILKFLAIKYDSVYPEDKLIDLARDVKVVVDDKAKYTDWNRREDIKAELKVDLIVLLAEHGYPPVDRDEVYKEIFEQAANFKKNRIAGASS